jgi:hypothetical protein
MNAFYKDLLHKLTQRCPEISEPVRLQALKMIDQSLWVEAKYLIWNELYPIIRPISIHTGIDVQIYRFSRQDF